MVHMCVHWREADGASIAGDSCSLLAGVHGSYIVSCNVAVGMDLTARY